MVYSFKGDEINMKSSNLWLKAKETCIQMSNDIVGNFDFVY